MTWVAYPNRKTKSCNLCRIGIIEAERKDGLPGVHLFRCPCAANAAGKVGHFPLWSEKFATNFKNVKEKRRAP